MDINIFLMTHRSYFPNRIDLMNNIKEKASSLSEGEKTKVTQTLAMYKFYNPALMTFLAIPLIIIGCVIFLVILGFVDDFIIRNIFGSKIIEGGVGLFVALGAFIYEFWNTYKNKKTYNYETLMAILNGEEVKNSFIKSYFNIPCYKFIKADADKLEEQQNQPNEQQWKKS